MYNKSIYIIATREMLNRAIENESFELWKTNTKVTDFIMSQSNKLLAYSEWVTTVSKVEKQPIYSDPTSFGEPECIGYRLVNIGDVHIEQLREWISDKESDGYEVSWYYM